MHYRAAAYLGEAKKCKASVVQKKAESFSFCTTEPQPILAMQGERSAKEKLKVFRFALPSRSRTEAYFTKKL
ncbi:MAG: hypothetical protein PUB53_02090 [Bacteroidales bacterium]|nr:hypothetical protein [Bacteroidales bacterium]